MNTPDECYAFRLRFKEFINGCRRIYNERTEKLNNRNNCLQSTLKMFNVINLQRMIYRPYWTCHVVVIVRVRLNNKNYGKLFNFVAIIVLFCYLYRPVAPCSRQSAAYE